MCMMESAVRWINGWVDEQKWLPPSESTSYENMLAWQNFLYSPIGLGTHFTEGQSSSSSSVKQRDCSYLIKIKGDKSGTERCDSALRVGCLTHDTSVIWLLQCAAVDIKDLHVATVGRRQLYTGFILSVGLYCATDNMSERQVKMLKKSQLRQVCWGGWGYHYNNNPPTGQLPQQLIKHFGLDS